MLQSGNRYKTACRCWEERFNTTASQAAIPLEGISVLILRSLLPKLPFPRTQPNSLQFYWWFFFFFNKSVAGEGRRDNNNVERVECCKIMGYRLSIGLPL